MPDNKGPSPLLRRYPPEIPERASRVVAETIAEQWRQRAVNRVARVLGIATEWSTRASR